MSLVLRDCFSVAIMVQTSNFAQSLQGCRMGALFSCSGSELLQRRAQIRCCTPPQCPNFPALHTAVSKTGQRYHSNSRVLDNAASGTGNKCFVPVRDTVIPTQRWASPSKSGKGLQNLLPSQTRLGVAPPLGVRDQETSDFFLYSTTVVLTSSWPPPAGDADPMG